MFENFKVFETELAGRPLVVETGKMAQLANGECLVRYGDTVVHVAATASAKPRDGIDFFPLSVDFEEKLYSVGKIPGSFLKREGRPSPSQEEINRALIDLARAGHAVVRLKGKIRSVLLPAILCRRLKEYAREKGISGGSIFVTKGGRPMDRSNILHEMKSVCRAAGVEKSKVFPHNLRHLFACTYYEKEKDLFHLADLLGHSSVNTTRLYTKGSGKAQVEKIEKLKLAV